VFGMGLGEAQELGCVVQSAGMPVGSQAALVEGLEASGKQVWAAKSWVSGWVGHQGRP